MRLHFGMSCLVCVFTPHNPKFPGATQYRAPEATSSIHFDNLQFLFFSAHRHPRHRPHRNRHGRRSSLAVFSSGETRAYGRHRSYRRRIKALPNESFPTRLSSHRRFRSYTKLPFSPPCAAYPRLPPCPPSDVVAAYLVSIHACRLRRLSAAKASLHHGRASPSPGALRMSRSIFFLGIHCLLHC